MQLVGGIEPLPAKLLMADAYDATENESPGVTRGLPERRPKACYCLALVSANIWDGLFSLLADF